MKPILALALVLALFACQDDPGGPGLAERAAGLQARMNTDTLIVDGQVVPVKFHEFKGGATFPAQFNVRYPEGLAVTAERGTLGDVVRLTQSADTAAGVWSITFLPEGTTEDAARETAMAVAGARSATTADSAASALLSQSGATSRVWLGQHAGRYLLVQSSADSAAAWDAFVPRTAFVEEHWTWTDDGTALDG